MSSAAGKIIDNPLGINYSASIDGTFEALGTNYNVKFTPKATLANNATYYLEFTYNGMYTKAYIKYTKNSGGGGGEDTSKGVTISKTINGTQTLYFISNTTTDTYVVNYTLVTRPANGASTDTTVTKQSRTVGPNTTTTGSSNIIGSFYTNPTSSQPAFISCTIDSKTKK